jgi:hypothetical protein
MLIGFESNFVSVNTNPSPREGLNLCAASQNVELHGEGTTTHVAFRHATARKTTLDFQSEIAVPIPFRAIVIGF